MLNGITKTIGTSNMAKIAELIDLAAWEDWVSSRPLVIRNLCQQYPPDRLYSMKPNGERVTIVSYSEDGTMTVNVSAQWNLVIFEREVFGVAPANLEECDLPTDEVTGVLLTTEAEVMLYCDILRSDMPNK